MAMKRLQLGRWKLLAGVVGLGASLSGCTPLSEYIHNGFKVGPNYKRPPAAVAPHWIDADDPRVGSVPVDDSHWWTVFDDPILSALVETAYKQNLSLREAGFRVLSARAQLAIAVGNLFPQKQDLYADATRKGLSETIANRQFTPTRWFNIFDTGININWELDFWGLYRRAVEQYCDQFDASIEHYDDALRILIGDVARAYARIRTAQKRIQYIQTNVELQRQTLDLVKIRFSLGAVSELDVEQATVNLERTSALEPPLQITLRQSIDQLCTLLGIPPEDLQKKIGLGPIPVAPVKVAVGIPAELLRRRPDVRQAERNMAAQNARIGQADAQMYPNISLNGFIGYQSSFLKDLFSDQSIYGMGGPSVQWNVLNYGRLINAVREADADYQAAVASYQNTVLTANQEVEDGLVEFLQSQQQAQILERAVAAAKKSVEIALVQYKEGKVDFNRVFLLERDLVTYMDDLAISQGNIAGGLVDTYRALGGGWQIRCKVNPCDPPPPLPPPAPGTVAATTPETLPAPRVVPAPQVVPPTQVPDAAGKP
jgi:NodT family efflux transporter outer membrane factor (OMF) lipoprotein